MRQNQRLLLKYLNLKSDAPITHYPLPITHYSLLITHYQLPITHYSLLITNYQLPITNYQLPITNYQLLITHYPLLNKMNEDYLPLAYLNAWEYCPRRFYLEYVLGEMEDNEHIILGRHVHRNINEEGTFQEGETLIHQQQWVWSERLKVSGIIDAVEEYDGQLVPVEYKKGKMAQHLNDHFQVCAAALCLEERTGRTITYGEIFYHANRRRQTVAFTPQLRQMTEQAIALAHVASQNKMPAPIDHPKKCQSCSLQGICLPFEVKQLQRQEY